MDLSSSRNWRCVCGHKETFLRSGHLENVSIPDKMMTTIQCILPLSLIIKNKRVRKVGFPPLEITANTEADEACD
jgi:hypothetical protein